MANEYASYKGVTYANGNLPSKWLKPLNGNNLALPGDPAVLREDAAASWNRAIADVKRRTGIDLTVRGWYRYVSQQQEFFFARYKKGAYSPFGDYRPYKGATYGRTNGAAAAIPGTSNHGLGTTVDVVDFGNVGQWNAPKRVKTIAILKEHGWDDTEGRGVIQEPWHLNYKSNQDKHRNDKPATPPVKEPYMSDAAEKKLDAVSKKIGGTQDGPSVAYRLRELQDLPDQVATIQALLEEVLRKIGGTPNGPSVLRRAKDIQDAVTDKNEEN